MKNIFKTALASLLLMASCATDEDFIIPTSTPDTFYASIEAPETRTYADEDGKLLWTANDQITIFKGNTTPLTFQFTGETGQNYGGFNNITPESGDEFVTSNPLNANYAIYPSVANTTISNAGVINFTIPATQNYAENSFGLGANVMVAVTEDKSDNNLSFKNLGGYFEFSLYGDVTVKSIEFKGNNGEDLAGAAAITATYNGTPTFEFTGETSKTLTLDCGAGVELGTEANPTKFWFVVPAITYSNGITITITDTEDGVMEKSTSKSITIDRSTLQPLNAFLVETEEVIPNNQIWYTSTDGNIVTPKYTNLFGTTYKSNVYENGKGIITFEGDVPYLGASVFYNCTTLSSITIPNSVSIVGDSAFQGCQNLTSVVLSNSLTSINTNAFYECKNLTEIYIPESVKEIKKSAFAKCSSLTNVNIPQNVNLIGKTSFTECNLLSSVTIGSNVTNIEEDAFCYCKNLSTVYCKPQNPPTLINSQYGGAFYNCASNLIIYVPASAIDAYTSANGWKVYADKIEGM